MAKKQPQITPDTSAFDALIKDAENKSKETGLVPDYKKLDKEAGGAVQGFSGAQGLYSVESADFYDAYEDYVDRNTLRGGQFDTDALNAIRAENQSNWEQTGNALGRLAVNIVPQIIGSTAAMLDLPGYFDEVEAANNSIVNWADSIKKSSSEALPIYEENPGGSMQLGDFAWWITRGEGLVESIASFAATGWGAGKLVSLGTKALARGLASTVLSAKNAKTVAGAVGQLGTATMMNQAEAVLEATQVYKTTYDNSLAKGKTPLQAKEDAARAAATTMNINRANILLNLTSAKAFLTPMKATRQLLTAPTTLGTLGKVLGEGAQEALEESINLVGQKAGEARGRGEKDYMAQGMKAVGTMEGLESAFLGAIGGMGQTAITSALQSSKHGPVAVVDAEGNKISYNENLRQQYQKQQKVLEELKQNGVKVTDALMNVNKRMKYEQELQDAANRGDTAKVEELRQKMFENMAIKSFQAGTTDILVEQLKEEMQQDPDVVGQEYIENAKEALKNLEQLEDVYNNYEEYANVDEIFFNRANEQRLNRQNKITQTLTKNAQVNFAQKVRDIAQKYNFTEEYDQIDKVNGEEVGRKTQTRDVPLNYVLSDLDNNQGDSEANKKTYDKFLKEVKKTPEYAYYEGYQAQSDVLSKQLEANQEEFAKLTSKSYQQEYAVKKQQEAKLSELKTKLTDATTIPDIQKLKNETEDELFQQLADAKIAEIEKSNAAAAKRKQVEGVMRDLRSKIRKATEDNYDDIHKAIDDAEISQDKKDQLKVEYTEHLERLKNPDPLNKFKQGYEADEDEDEEGDNEQDNKDFASMLPEDLPQPGAEYKDVSQAVINSAEELLNNDKTTAIGIDENGNIIYNYEKTNEGFNRAAYLAREFNQTDTVGFIEREEFTDQINNNPGTRAILDPDGMLEGTTLFMTVDHDYEGDKYDPNSTTRDLIPWPARLAELRQLATERNVALEKLPEYIREVPIKVTTEDKQTVFYVHDNTWYKPENLDNTPEAIAEDQRKNFLVRAAIIKNGVVRSKVNYKSFGRLFKTADGQAISVAEAMPDDKLIIAVGKDGDFSFAGDKESLLGPDAVILNKQGTQPGRPYAVVKVGPKHYTAIPLERKKLSAEVVTSISLAVEGYLSNDQENPIVKAILDSTGLDITDAIQLGQYMNQFTYLFPLEKGLKLENFLMQGGINSPLKSTTPLITINPNGIEFGLPGTMMNKYVDIEGVEQQRFGVTISQNFEDTTFGKNLNKLNLTRLEKVLEKALSNVRIEDLQSNRPTVLVLNRDGETRSMSYLDSIKESHQTNIISANIGTDEEPKWIYAIQPAITFDTSFVKNINKKATNAKRATSKNPQPNNGSSVPVVQQGGVKPTARGTATASINQTFVDEITNDAEQWLSQVDIQTTKNYLEALLERAIKGGDARLEQIGLKNYEYAIKVINKAIELYEARSKNSKSTTLPNGLNIKIDDNTKDDPAISDDTFDDSIVEMTPGQVQEATSEIANYVLTGVDPRTQDSIKAYIAADIMKQALAAKEVGGQKQVETLPIFEKHKESFKQLAAFYRENGFPNKAARIDALVDQFPKLQSIVNQYMATMTTGKVDEQLDFDESEQAVGLEKTVYSDDWTFTINSKSTASADLRKFFAFIEDRNEDGEVVTNSLGFPEIIPFDTVYDTLHMILAGSSADLDVMLERLEVFKEAFPWLQTVIDNIEDSPERIKNEFVSDMAKHHISMKYIQWGKDKQGNYTVQRWSSNASSIEERLRDNWNNNLVNSNVVVTNENDQYIFDAEVVAGLVETARAWEKDPKNVTVEELAQWLGNIGITLEPKTYEDLKAGKYNNNGRKPWETLFTASSGLVKVLANRLEQGSIGGAIVDEYNLLNDSAVKSLAKLDAVNTAGNYSNSFRAGGKTIYSYGNNNYLVNRMRDLTAYDSQNKKFYNQDLINNLNEISFTRDSLWLKALQDQSDLGAYTRQVLGLDYLSLEALKKQYTRSKDKRKLNNLNIDEHEVVRLGMFFNSSKKKIGNKTYRQVSYFYPTMSDKTTMIVINGLAEEIKLTPEGLSKADLQTLYNAVVQPEINRIRGEQPKDIKGYEPNYFYFFPGLNELMIEVNGTQKSFRDIVMAKDQSLSNPEVKQGVLDYLQKTFGELVKQKEEDWNKLGIGKTIKDENNRTTDQYTFLDKEYMRTHTKGTSASRVSHAAANYVFNNLVASSEIMKLFTGDPALYAKFDSKQSLAANLEALFINMGKRLAGDIAPGIELADSMSNKYYQVFLEDNKIASNNVLDKEQKAFFENIVSSYSHAKKGYGAIEGSDAQEYTTWKEHLYVLKQLGRLTQAQYNLLTSKLTKQSQGILNDSTKLKYDEIGLVLQPMKPVYVGNMVSRKDNVDRRVYIKSSSFPLIPQFTTGFQLDKIRQALETFEESKKNELGPDGSPKFVRASFGTANKVGNVKNSLKVFDDNGNVVDNLEVNPEQTLEMSRANFRIQQDVPYKREKDQVNIGTQERKLLFVNLLDLQVTKDKKGSDLQAEYDKAYQDLFEYAQEKLAVRLGLKEEVVVDNVFSDFANMALDGSIVDTVATKMDEISKIKAPIKKQTAQQEFADEIGADNLERINFINQNFDKIVEGLVNSKINFFFDENEEFKNCD